MEIRSFRRPALVLALLAALVAFIAPASASALTFRIVNQSDESDEDVYVDIAANGAFEVPGWTNDQSKPLSEIPGGEVTIEKLISGRVYISYGEPVHEGVPFNSPTRFDWAEMTVTPATEDVANLTAVDQFAIGMRLTTLGGSGEELETVGSANSDTVFDALQKIPGGAESTIRNEGKIIRVLSPLHSSAYPLLGDYVRSLAGQTVTLHTAFFGAPFVTTEYSGTFQADGSIALTGTTNPLSSAPETFEIEGTKLIEDIYTGNETPNTIEGAIRRDLLAGFSTGLWDGKYGNDALNFCSDAVVNGPGSFCPHGFNKPAFGEARPALSPFPTCEQYAAVINQLSDVYGNPYSDASKKVAVGLNQAQVKTLQLTILPDSGTAMPSVGGNSNCGAGTIIPPASGTSVDHGSSMPKNTSTTPSKSKVTFKLPGKAKVKKGSVAAGSITCSGVCGKVEATLRRGKTVLARTKSTIRKPKASLSVKLTKPGKRALSNGKPLRAKLTVTVTQPGSSSATKTTSLRLLP